MKADVQNSAATAIHGLAGKYKVAYTQTATDLLASQITRLSGDDIEFDETELLLIALQRAGRISRTDAVRLQADYLGRFSDPDGQTRYQQQQRRQQSEPKP